MTDLRKAAQQALEALEFLSLDFFMLDPISPGREEGNKAITALRAALAEPVQEPYCHVYEYDGVFGLHREFYPREYNGRKPDRAVPLFTAPQRRAEPVAKVELMMTGGNAGLSTRIVEIDDHFRERLRPGQLLYAAPPTRSPLTDEEKSDD